MQRNTQLCDFSLRSFLKAQCWTSLRKKAQGNQELTFTQNLQEPTDMIEDQLMSYLTVQKGPS